MDNTIYAQLGRQVGLMREMQLVANNIANASTTGFRTEELIYSEYVQRLNPGAPSLSMAAARVRDTLFDQGAMTQTGGTFDLAIEGEGFFMVATPEGERLTRAGAFTPNENGDLVTSQGHPVLDPGGAPVFVPVGAGPISIAPDGTISVGGEPVGQVGLYLPEDPTQMVREDGVRFRSESPMVPADGARMMQGFLEESNVNPVLQVARMIEVGRAYELGQSLIEREDRRIRDVIQTMKR